MPKKKSDSEKEEAEDSSSQQQIPAVPPPDDPMERSTEFDPDRDYKSREMAEKRLAAIRKTREMPTANGNSAESGPDSTLPKEESDSA
jgi:hypothetical protein